MSILTIYAQTIQTKRLALFAVGYFSEILMVLISVLLFYGRQLDLVVYIVGAAVNVFLNKVVLKPLIKQPRPPKPIKFLHSENFTYNHATYGMPSGHSQFVFYSIAYLYLTLNEMSPWLIFASAIGAATIYERWAYRNHTLEQLIAGAFVGIALAYGIVWTRDEYFSN